MSIVALARVMDCSEAKLGARLVLFVLAEHAHDDGSSAYPAVDTMVKRTRLSRRAVQEALRRLERDGEVTRDGVADKGQTRWQLTFKGGRRNCAPGGAVDDTQGAQNLRPNRPLNDAESALALSASGRARDGGKVDLPDEFPDELREHLKRVYRLLRDLAQREGAKAIKPVSLAYVVMARPRKPLIAAAHDCAAHWHGKHPKDVVACYRNWLDRTDDLADVERLDAPPASTNGRQRMNPERPASDHEAELLRRFHERERAQQPTTKGASE